MPECSISCLKFHTFLGITPEPPGSAASRTGASECTTTCHFLVVKNPKFSEEGAQPLSSPRPHGEGCPSTHPPPLLLRLQTSSNASATRHWDGSQAPAEYGSSAWRSRVEVEVGASPWGSVPAGCTPWVRHSRQVESGPCRRGGTAPRSTHAVHSQTLHMLSTHVDTNIAVNRPTEPVIDMLLHCTGPPIHSVEGGQTNNGHWCLSSSVALNKLMNMYCFA